METQDKIHNPLFAELFRIAIPLLEGYHSDLGHDTLRLASAVPGERFLWGVRKHGTEMRSLDEDPDARASISQTLLRFPDHRWYVLEVTEVRLDGYCAGTVTRLPPAGEAAQSPRQIAGERFLHERLDPLHHEPRDLHGYVQDNDVETRAHKPGCPAVDGMGCRCDDDFKEPL